MAATHHSSAGHDFTSKLGPSLTSKGPMFLPLSLGFFGTTSQFIRLQLLLQKDFKGEEGGNFSGNPVV